MAIALCLSVATAAPADDECRLYTYKAEVTEVVDGDTVRVDIDLGFHIWIRDETLRLYGIDAPELRGYGGRRVTEDEKRRGRAAKAALIDKIEGREVELCTIKDKKGKYGRYLARLFLDGVDVNEWLISEGHAAPYPKRAAALQ